MFISRLNGYQRKRLAWGLIACLLVALIVSLSVYFGTRPETVAVVETQAEETLPSLIKVAPLGVGALLIEYTELLEDNSTVFYYLSTQDLNATTLEGVTDIDSIALYLTRSKEPSIEDLSNQLVVRNLRGRRLEKNETTVLRIGLLNNVSFPFKLPDYFLPGDFNGAILVEETQENLVEVTTASFSVLVEPEQNIASPTAAPSAVPSESPTAAPSSTPSTSPTNPPSQAPSKSPTSMPSTSPSTTSPTVEPTKVPTQMPTRKPTAVPSTKPSPEPTSQPSVSNKPSERDATQSPTASPTKAPTQIPTTRPSTSPSTSPTDAPSNLPSASPISATVAPTQNPTKAPSRNPTTMPTKQPTKNPTNNPTKPPTLSPTEAPVSMSLPILTSELSGSYDIGGTITIDYVQGFENGQVVDLPRLQFDIPDLSDAPGPYLYLSKRSYSETRRGDLEGDDILVRIDAGQDGQFNVKGRFDQFLDEVSSAEALQDYANGSWIVWCQPFGVWIGGGEISEAR